MPDEIGILLKEEEKTLLKIGGREFSIGKLKLKTVLRLAKLIGKLAIEQSRKLSEFKESDTNAKDLITFFGMLDEKELANAISILLETDDMDFCREIAFEDFENIIIAICGHNDLGKILKKAERIIGEVSKKTTAAS